MDALCYILLAALVVAITALVRVRAKLQELRGKNAVLEKQVSESLAKQAELDHTIQTLSRDRDLIGALMENIPDQIYFKDLQSRFVRVSKGVTRTLGAKSEKDIVGKDDRAFFPESDAAAFRADDESVMASGKTLVDRIESGTVNGQMTWMSTTKAPVYDASGNVVGLVGISRDITDRKHTEEALEHERDLLRALMDNVPDRIYFKDSDGRFLRVNRAMASDPESLVGKSEFDLFPKDVAEASREEERAILGTGKPVIDKLVAMNGPKGQIWLSVTKVPLFDKAGRAIGLVGVSRDITARKRAEDLLHEVIDRAECILWSAQVKTRDDGTYSWDLKMLSAEPLRRWLGLDVAGAQELDLWRKHILREDMERMDRVSGHALRNGLKNYQQEFRVRGVDGSLRVMAESTEITPLGDGRFTLVGVIFDVTEQKAALTALHESEARLRLLVEQMPAILWSTDENLRFTSSLGAGLSGLGLKPNEVVGVKLQDFFKTSDPGFTGLAMHRRALNGESVGFEMKWADHIFQNHIEPLRDSNGVIKGTVGLALDVTERYRVQEALRASEYLLRQVLDTNPNIILVRDGRGCIILANAALAEFYDTTLDRVSGRNHEQIHLESGCNAQEMAVWLEDDQDIIKTGKPKLHLARATRANGRVAWYRTKKLPLTLADGVKAVLVIKEDVSDLKQAEEELAKERDLLQALMDNVPDNIYFKDAQSRYIRINTYQAYHIGLSHPSEAAGKTDFDFYPADRAQEFYIDEREVLAGRRIVGKVEKQYTDGSPERWTLTSKVPFYGRDGKIMGVVGVSKDITDLKKMERQLANANEQLNKLAREDALTGLLNRRMILELADNEWARWQRYGKVFSLLVVDADNFKSINDKHGHLAGDQALRYIAARMSEALRAVDIIGRYGGEEFVILLPETNMDGAVFAAEKLLQNVRKSPLHVNGQKLCITVSVGIAAVRREDRNIDMLLNRADLALYNAKRNGKDQLATAAT